VSRFGMTLGSPAIGSVGPITFGPDDVLFVADNLNAKVFAIDTADAAPAGPNSAFDLDDLDARLAAFLGCDVSDVIIRDMTTHPRTHNVYLSVMRGRGDLATPVIVRVDVRDGHFDEIVLDDVVFSEVSISNAPAADDERLDVQLPDAPEGDEVELHGKKLRIARVPARTSTITDLAYIDGTILVAGMSNEEFSSNLRQIPFPFTGGGIDNSLEIFHVSHGKWETAAPIRTLMPYDGGRSVLASYTCTPLVQFSLSDLAGNAKVVGRTVAELGSMNQPLDIVAFEQDGREHLLVAHSSHPLMKIDCADIEAQGPLTSQDDGVGVRREEIDVPGVRRLANLNDEHVLALRIDDAGRRSLHSLKTAAL
jgi:hypothetical protein